MNLDLMASLPKSIYYNIKIFGFRKGLKLIVLFHNKTSVNVCKGGIEVPEFVGSGDIKIGFGETMTHGDNDNEKYGNCLLLFTGIKTL